MFSIGSPTNAQLGAVNTHTLSIVDNDSVVNVQFAAATMNVSESSGSFPVYITLSTIPLTDVVVPLTFAGTATGADYTVDTSAVTIPAGRTRAIFTVRVTDDTLDEQSETIVIGMGTPTGAISSSPFTTTITIEDNDPVLSFARSSDITTDESGTITVMARSLSPVIADLTVPFASFGSATLGVDYTLSANAFQFLAGASTAAVTLTIVDDAVVESSEAVTLSLQPPPNTTLGSPGLFTLFISDNDTAPTVGLDLNGLAAGKTS